MTFAPKVCVTYDVFYLLKDGTRQVAAKDVDQFEAERLAFHPGKPKGAKFVCKIRR